MGLINDLEVDLFQFVRCADSLVSTYNQGPTMARLVMTAVLLLVVVALAVEAKGGKRGCKDDSRGIMKQIKNKMQEMKGGMKEKMGGDFMGSEEEMRCPEGEEPVFEDDDEDSDMEPGMGGDDNEMGPPMADEQGMGEVNDRSKRAARRRG